MVLNTTSSLALVVACVAVFFDLRERRIPNWLTFGGALVAFILSALLAGPRGFGLSIGGWALGAVLFLPLFLLGGMGAGDVKLLAALGACVGPVGALWIAIYGSIAGGVIALAVSLWAGYLRSAIANLRM